MRFTTAALFAFVAAVVAQGPNPITNPLGDEVIEAGKPVKITWQPTTEGKVTLILRKGESGNLDTIKTIVETDNSGEFTWTPSEELEGDDDYAIEIKDADGNSNYSPKFQLESEGEGLTPTTTAAPTRSTATTSAEETETETSTESTSTSSRTSSAPRPTATDSEEEEEEEEEEDIPNTNENSATKAASPLALIFCVAMAVAYLN